MDLIDALTTSLQRYTTVKAACRATGRSSALPAAARVPVDPAGVPLVVDRRPGASTCRRRVAALPAARDEPTPGRAAAVTLDSRWCSPALRPLIGSFLNVVIHRLPLGSRSCRRPRAAACGYPLPWYDNVPVLSWLCWAGSATSAAPASRSSTASSSWSPALLFLLVVWLTPAGPLLAGAADAGVHPDRALRHRSRASDPAERRSRCRASSIGLLFSLVAPPGWKEA